MKIYSVLTRRCFWFEGEFSKTQLSTLWKYSCICIKFPNLHLSPHSILQSWQRLVYSAVFCPGDQPEPKESVELSAHSDEVSGVSFHGVQVSPGHPLCCYTGVHSPGIYLDCNACLGGSTTRTFYCPQLTEHVRWRKTEADPVCSALFRRESLRSETSELRSLVLLMLSGSLFLDHLTALT